MHLLRRWIEANQVGAATALLARARARLLHVDTDVHALSYAKKDLSYDIASGYFDVQHPSLAVPTLDEIYAVSAPLQRQLHAASSRGAAGAFDTACLATWIPCRSGYHAARDTTPLGIPCRSGCVAEGNL